LIGRGATVKPHHPKMMIFATDGDDIITPEGEDALGKEDKTYVQS